MIVFFRCLCLKHDCHERQNLQSYNLVAVDQCERSTSQGNHINARVKLYTNATSCEVLVFSCKTKFETVCQKEYQVGSKLVQTDRYTETSKNNFFAPILMNAYNLFVCLLVRIIPKWIL